ncbi:paraquat-inducible protein A [Jannaschia seohaensis]|uniref:Paraquat-inducible protein A n=1 Tax=Jannaschia seohaensis TaxID=475081 RepID=A0A2Y9BW71_9RHOB|nr:paraquat-inducible protein A [Jannaschia seohaensis]PWJ22314.1 paraquat-inducible protein A [Jannaschia seohaensis]SSA38592.1 paraquat-inducible protein A [Jannaschia seohaensis]
MRASPDMVCCPVCDALHHLTREPATGEKARCIRCGTVIANGKPQAILHIVVLASTALVLMTIVVFYPFLELRTGVFDSRASVFETVMSFSQGIMAPLSIAVAAFVIVLPVARLGLLIWALGPLSVDRTPWPGAARALRYAEILKPWAMAEIFMVGVAVALVKLADLATLSMGPAFWSFAAIVIITALKDTQMSKHSVWTALDTATRR